MFILGFWCFHKKKNIKKKDTHFNTHFGADSNLSTKKVRVLPSFTKKNNQFEWFDLSLGGVCSWISMNKNRYKSRHC